MRASRLILVLGLLLGGCDAIVGEAPPDDDVPQEPETPPADALEARLRERGAEVAPWMIRDGEALRGEAEEGGARDFSHAMHPGWCYKVIGLGDEGITDLDLRVYDPNQVLIQRDTTRDPQPYLGQMRPICPGQSGTFRIEARVVSGSGPFAVQVYRSI